MRRESKWSVLWRTEDWWTIWLGFLIVIGAVSGVLSVVPKLPKWSQNIANALPFDMLPSLVLLGIGIAVFTAIAVKVIGGDAKKYLIGFPAVYLLAVAAYIIGNQATLNHYGFSNIIWALVLGILISNVFGKPKWLIPALRTELFIKTGLVLLGAEILFNRVLALGLRGLGVAWIVTPIVVSLMYYFGTKILNLKSKSLVATIATTTSVCGVSAAIATGAAVKAKKEEISAAISVSLIFTIIMMVGLPFLIKLMGLSELVAGAWIGGTVDSTGAVVAAGSMVGPAAMEAAAIVKMLQNVLIGFVAFGWAIYFVTKVERKPTDAKPSLIEIWHRFPKFILGFIVTSVLFSFVLLPTMGQASVDGILNVTSTLRGWLFALAFVSIGLDSKFSDLRRTFKGSGPIKLYVVGQTLNLVLTLGAALFFFQYL